MPDDSTDGGTDNPAFSHDEETSSAGRGSESAACNSSGDEKTTVNENGNHSFVSKHYVEPRKSPEPHFKTETRIEVPDETTTQDKPKQNGHNANGNNNDVSFLNTTVTSVSNNDVNDKKEQIEAVNLELVSMKPYSGSNNHQTKNQEACEVPADPYEEYFVPVNEHRKYIRGEKLYVTKDKRSTKSCWRKAVCWGCGFLIVAIIAIIAILAATGVILSQEDTQPLLNSDKTSSRQFNDAHPAGSQEYIKNPPSSPPPATSTFPPWPTTDESLYRHVPKALDGVIKLDDLDWNDNMNDPKSRVYREVIDDLEKSLVKMLSLNDVMPIVKVHSISKDGEVKFRVSQPVFEKPEDNQNHLEDKFRQNGSAIGRYHVNRLQIGSLVDHCYSGKMECSDSCVYDYLETIFICMCPTGKSFDSRSKKCVDNPELSHPHFGGIGSEDVQGRSRLPDDTYHPESHEWKDSHYGSHDPYNHHHEHTSLEPISELQPVADPKAEPEPAAEPTSEPEPSSEPEPATEPKVVAEPASEPKSEPEPSSKQEPVTEPTSEPKSEPEPSSKPEPVAEPTSEPKSEPEPSSKPEPAAEPASEPKSEPEPVAEPTSEPKSEPEPSSEPEPAAESATKSNNEPETSSEPEPVAKPAAEPKSEPDPPSKSQLATEPASEPKSEPEPSSEPIAVLSTEPKAEPSPAAEPTAEPKVELEAVAEPKSEPEPSSEPAPVAEPSASAGPKTEPEPVVEPKAEPEPAAVPKAEPEPSAEPKAEPELSSKPAETTVPKSDSEPIAEPKSEPEPVSELKNEYESSDQPKNEPVEEPKSKPAILSNIFSADSTTLPSIDFEPEKNIVMNKDLVEKKVEDSLAKHESNDPLDTVTKIPLTSAEFSTISNEPATVIGLRTEQVLAKETTTQIYNDNQSSTEKSSNANKEIETDTIPGKSLDKKAPRLDNDEQDTPNPFEKNVKDVVNSNNNNEQNRNTNMNVNDRSTHNINLTSKIESHENHEIKNIGEKNEVSPEEQYNDITDDFVPKGFGTNDIEISNDLKKDERKIQKIYKENRNINYTQSKVDPELADKLVLKSTTTPAVEVLDKRIEDLSMTSQVPILPIEIQLDMSTTETAEKVYPQATSQDSEKETSTTAVPKTTNVEGKTTEQIPILPEELQTTITNKQEQHTESILSIEKEKIEEEKILKPNESNLNTESTTYKDIIDEDLIEKTTVYNVLHEKNESAKDNIKPVFESISDDTMPQMFEYKYLLTTTTEKPELANVFEEMTEEQLRVIPLEEKETYRPSQKPDDQMKVKKEKELSFKTPENVNTVDKKSSRTVEDDNIPKLISGSSSDNDPDEGLKTIFISPDFNSSNVKTIAPPTVMKPNSTDTAKYPNFIPVSEEIDESDYHFTEPSQFNNHNVIATDLPELHLEGEQNRTNKEVEGDVKESTTELLQAVESSTNKTKLVENVLTKIETNGNESNIVKSPATGENKMAVSSTSQPDQSEFLGIPVAIVTSEEFAPSQIFFSKCKSGQFQCINGTSRDGSYCVDLSSTCDSENDCSDGSDELDCEKEGCPGNFQCASGQCLKRHLVCNGIVDCDDGSDEKECSNWKCHFDEFQCPNGRCIPVLWQCDGRPDCENHADEYSCSESCGNDEYLCPTEKWCIPQTWRCNGVSECVNGEDEKLCECAVDQFKCETGGCIPAEQLCDGVENCPDRSDEWNCLSGFSKNSSVSTEVDKENKENEFSTKSTSIKIRQSNGEQRYICSDGWTDAFSDQYCRTLGFAASESTQTTEVGTDKKLLQLISNANPNSSIVLNLEKTDSCKSDKIVEVSCQEFSCGSHESGGPTARLVGGTPATEGQWSSVALLKEPKYGTACTASILSPMYALASYSCIYSNRQSSGWQLFVGGNLLKPNKVKNIVPYPQVKYNQFLYNNDIALVELAEPLVFSRNISAACLPNQSFQPPELCVTVGWGFPVNGKIDLQQYLKFLPVPTYNSEECNATSHYAGFITKNNICAGFTDTDKGPCYNDEGAPLMCVSETGRWEIQGLLSHHSRCSRGHPAIYSSLAPALSWLRNSVPALQTHS